jgi:hypothetical protein
MYPHIFAGSGGVACDCVVQRVGGARPDSRKLRADFVLRQDALWFAWVIRARHGSRPHITMRRRRKIRTGLSEFSPSSA